MIACLRSARFLYPDRSASVFVELRRFQDTKAWAQSSELNKFFLVTKRFSRLRAMTRKQFGSYREAAAYWQGEVAKLEDQGLLRSDVQIIGFREEG